MNTTGDVATPPLPRQPGCELVVRSLPTSAWTTVAAVVLVTGVPLWLRVEGLAG